MALSKEERQKLFVQQRTAELAAAGKAVDTAALTARFNELAATPEGRKQITSKVQLANAPQAAADAAANQEAFNSLYNYRNSLLSPQPVVPPEDIASTEDGVTSEDVKQIIRDFNRQQNQQDTETASSILAATLKYYGMDEPALLQDVKTALADRRITGASTIDDIGIQLRESDAFKRRFGANEARRAANKPAYSVSQYLQLESSYRQVLNAAGMPKDFYTDRTDIESFITNDISPDEVQFRVQQGYAAVKNADPAVVNELKTLYGLDEGTLAAYFIDPNKTKDAVVRSARAAEVAAQARKQADIGLTAAQAEQLVLGGVTEQEAQQAFTSVRSLQELTRPTAGEQALTQEELIQGVTGINAAAQQRVAKTARRRQATLQEGGKAGLGTVGE
jgi:hypothetical protein